MQTSRASWARALRNPQDALRAIAGPLAVSQLAAVSHLAHLLYVHKYPVVRTGHVSSGS